MEVGSDQFYDREYGKWSFKVLCLNDYARVILRGGTSSGRLIPRLGSKLPSLLAIRPSHARPANGLFNSPGRSTLSSCRPSPLHGWWRDWCRAVVPFGGRCPRRLTRARCPTSWSQGRRGSCRRRHQWRECHRCRRNDASPFRRHGQTPLSSKGQRKGRRRERRDFSCWDSLEHVITHAVEVRSALNLILCGAAVHAFLRGPVLRQPRAEKAHRRRGARRRWAKRPHARTRCVCPADWIVLRVCTLRGNLIILKFVRDHFDIRLPVCVGSCETATVLSRARRRHRSPCSRKYDWSMGVFHLETGSK